MKALFSALLFLFLCSTVWGQEWGQVSAEELVMTKIEEDPEADAIIPRSIRTVFSFYYLSDMKWRVDLNHVICKHRLPPILPDIPCRIIFFTIIEDMN
jgi:hypothetical protein